MFCPCVIAPTKRLPLGPTVNPCHSCRRLVECKAFALAVGMALLRDQWRAALLTILVN
jgi:hypothetical protein